MKVSRLKIQNFRGIRAAELILPDHVVFIGDNNTGKSTLLEAIDLVLGPDRLSRRSQIDEHDFYCGQYLKPEMEDVAQEAGSHDEANESEKQGDAVLQNVPTQTNLDTEASESKEQGIVEIKIEVTVTNLSDDQRARFKDYIEWWNTQDSSFYTKPNIEGIDEEAIVEALRFTFIGSYVVDEDDFEGKTYFSRSLEESATPFQFMRKDKQFCGFLYLRSVRTGSRALSLEHGSLLDIILRIKEIRPQMWEATISKLTTLDVAGDPELGISGVLESINTALNKYVPKEWGVEPQLRVSALTREHLRKVITAFVATGDGEHTAPYYRQGTGTINMLVLSMLSQIAEDKQNVIFAMEEPETAIPPYAQKRIVHEVRKLAAQSLFTSHSPYVLEEFDLDETVVLSRSSDGLLSQASVELPDSVKLKRYRQEFRTRFCEGLLSRRVLLAEGATEATAFPVAARRLAELNPTRYASLEALGITTLDAGSDSQLADLGQLYTGLGKTVYGLCDKQTTERETEIRGNVDELFMHEEEGIEELVLANTTEDALNRFSDSLTWPPHLEQEYPDPKADVENSVRKYFGWSKGNWGVADFLAQCREEEIPLWIRETCAALATSAAPIPAKLSEPSADLGVGEVSDESATEVRQENEAPREN